MQSMNSKILAALLFFHANAAYAVVEFKADDVVGAPSAQVAVPVRVFNFNDIVAFQGTIQFDPTVIAYNTISLFGLPGMTISDFNTAQVSNGILTYLWIDPNPSATGVSVPDSSVIFEITFDVVGMEGQQSLICFANAPTLLEVADTTGGGNPVMTDYFCGSVQIPGGTLPVANVSTTDVRCFGENNGTASVFVSGGVPPYTYRWSRGDTSAGVTGLHPGVYAVTVTDANNAADTVSNVTISEPPQLTVTSIQVTHVSACGANDGSATVYVSGGTLPYNYNWSNGGTTVTISGLAGGFYTVLVTDYRGCTVTDAVTVTQPSSISASVDSVKHISCHGGNDGYAEVSGTGGNPPYLYLWSNGMTTSAISNVAAGTYLVTVTDNNSCATVLNVAINQPAELNVSTSVTGVSCHGGNDGSASAAAAGGTPPYSFSWGSGQVHPNNLSAGSYPVTATDAHGCTATATAVITEPNELIVSASVVSHVSCYGGNDGSANANALGGTPPYSYSWSSGTGTAGTHTVTATDNNGCTASATVTFTQPDALSLSLTVTQVTVNGGSDGAVDLSVSGGTAPYTYAWSNGAATQDIGNLTAAVYSVVVTDANGCTASGSAAVTGPVSVFNVAAADKLKIFPNPNDGNFEIEMEGREHFNTIELLDPLGQTVYSAISGTSAFSGKRISVKAKLDKGIYIIRLTGSCCFAAKIVVVEN